jgi:hypothetical protein
MKDTSFKSVQYEGIKIRIPGSWFSETETYEEADGSTSYSLNLCGRGRDARCINISVGMIPEGSDAHIEASRAYEEVVSEEDLAINEEPIICFEFQKKEAFGFNVWTEEGVPCFFFCYSIPGDNQLVTVLVSALSNDELQSLVDFVEEYLSVE